MQMAPYVNLIECLTRFLWLSFHIHRYAGLEFHGEFVFIDIVLHCVGCQQDYPLL
jgi:hypothetical protein